MTLSNSINSINQQGNKFWVGLKGMALVLLFFGISQSVEANPSPIAGITFSDGFESGDTSAWDSTKGNITARANAALLGNYGVRVNVFNKNTKYIEDLSPDQFNYSASFMIDINSLTMDNHNRFRLFQARDQNQQLAYVVLKRGNQKYWIRGVIKNDIGSNIKTNWLLIADQSEKIILKWRRAYSPANHNGYLKLYLNNELKRKKLNINNDLHKITSVQIGVTKKINQSANIFGKFFIDDFASHDPAPLSTPTINFAAIGDYGNDSAAEGNVANLVNSWTPDFIITLGDNNYPDGKAVTIDNNIGKYYCTYIKPYSGSCLSTPTTNKFFPALGNHDWNTVDAQPYLDYFTLPGNERYYDFVRGTIHFFVIDSDGDEPDGITYDSTQGQWLMDGLSNSSSRWNIVYMHHTIFTSHTRAPHPALRWPYRDWGADIVLSGHDHMYERLIINDFPYVINGLGGRRHYSSLTPGAGSIAHYIQNHGALKIS
ncbi:MAG: metallophosphoesterase, partial [Chloroflexota bacterium]